MTVLGSQLKFKESSSRTSSRNSSAAGGWQNSLTLKKVYQQADAETMLHVVLGGGELRERKA